MAEAAKSEDDICLDKLLFCAQSSLQVGMCLGALAMRQRGWSEATFGKVETKGPLGSLRHLEKEVREAIEAVLDREKRGDASDEDDVLFEYADILILLLDITWRSRLTIDQLIDAGREKMRVNEARKWPKVTDPNQPVEHDRGGE